METPSFWLAVVERLALTANTLGVLVILEMTLPTQAYSLKSRLLGVGFWAVWVPVTVATFAALQALWQVTGVQPLATLHVDRWFAWSGPFAPFLAPLVAAVIGDFFFYWFHRGQHAFFWRLHAVHHSIEDLHAVNSYHHVSEEAVRFLLFAIPTSLVLTDGGAAPVVIAVLLGLQPFYLHSSARVHAGPLRRILVDNRFHRIHHSLEPEHFNKNFGACTTLWDQAFGTAYFPKRGEWPATGLADCPQPRSFADWLLLPLRYRPKRASLTPVQP